MTASLCTFSWGAGQKYILIFSHTTRSPAFYLAATPFLAIPSLHLALRLYPSFVRFMLYVCGTWTWAALDVLGGSTILITIGSWSAPRSPLLSPPSPPRRPTRSWPTPRSRATLPPGPRPSRCSNATARDAPSAPHRQDPPHHHTWPPTPTSLYTLSLAETTSRHRTTPPIGKAFRLGPYTATPPRHWPRAQGASKHEAQAQPVQQTNKNSL